MTANNPAKTSGAPRFEFWFEFASTYSYLSAARIADLAAAQAVPVDYRPFLLGPIFQTQGWNDSPFNIYPAKGRYMWRDLERKCIAYGLPYRRPGDFPRNGLRAARIATALIEDAATAGAASAFVSRVYEANFAHDKNIAEEGVLKAILQSTLEAGATSQRDPATVLALSKSNEIKNRLRERTDRAVQLGIFGAPSFVISPADDSDEVELFWGDDRLEDALDCFETARKQS